MRLKGALFWSLILHAGLLIAAPPLGIVSSEKFFHPPELTFLSTVTGSMTVAPVVKATPAAPARVSPPLTVPRQAPPEVVKPTSPKIQELPAPAVPEKVKRELHSKSVELHTTAVPAGALAEKEFAQFAYRKKLREHLKRHLLYPSGFAEGTIRVRLALSPTGALKQARIIEASDPQLAAACLEGVQSAAPFPPLPKELSLAEADVEFLVQYRSN